MAWIFLRAVLSQLQVESRGSVRLVWYCILPALVVWAKMAVYAMLCLPWYSSQNGCVYNARAAQVIWAKMSVNARPALVIRAKMAAHAIHCQLRSFVPFNVIWPFHFKYAFMLQDHFHALTEIYIFKICTKSGLGHQSCKPAVCLY